GPPSCEREMRPYVSTSPCPQPCGTRQRQAPTDGCEPDRRPPPHAGGYPKWKHADSPRRPAADASPPSLGPVATSPRRSTHEQRLTPVRNFTVRPCGSSPPWPTLTP